MTTHPNYRATTRGVQLAATVVAACATLALFAALRPGELPERTLRWAGVQIMPSVPSPRVPEQTLSPRVATATPAAGAQHPLTTASR